MNKKIILFVCGHNAGRSQMAEAYFNYINTNQNFLAISCGTHPSAEINPVVKNLLKTALNNPEISGKNPESFVKDLYPKKITPELEKNAEKIITMGCGVNCSAFSSDREITDWDLSDPHGKGEEFVKAVFEEIKIHVESLISSLSDKK